MVRDYGAGKSNKARSRLIDKIAAWISGYDVFISYRHQDAYEYACQLEKLLEAEGLMVFRDETEEDVGTPLPVFIKRALSARTFVILVTPSVYESTGVLEEISAYLEGRMDKWYRRPFSRVLSVNVDQVLSNAPAEPAAWRRLQDYVYVPEHLAAIDAASPSPVVMDRLKRASSFLRSWQRFVAITVVVAVAVLSGVLWTTLQLNETIDRLSETQTSLAGSTKELIAAQATTKKLRTETDALETERYMLTVRNAAADQLTIDPVVAYRLAERAYRLAADPINRRLLLQSASSIDLAYQVRKPGYSIGAIAEPYILLKPATEESRHFAVYDMRTHETISANTSADRGWIAPVGEYWRVLALDWVGEDSLDSIPTYKLLDHAGRQLGDSVESGGLAEARFLTPTRVLLQLRGEPKLLVWDLATDTRKRVELEVEDDLVGGGYFRSIYGALDSKRDGSYAAHHRDGLVLVRQDGKIQPDSYTEVEFDPSSFFSAARWSSDDQYLALDHFNRGRLGVWHPPVRAFHWLDPSGWVVNAYGWSHSGHWLAFSGRTENKLDVTVEIIDAGEPEASRRMLYEGDVPLQGLAFLPGDQRLAIADRDGEILLLDVTTSQLLGHGTHPRVKQIQGSKYAMYTSSETEFRVWGDQPVPARQWTFWSSSDRTYGSKGTADPGWRWLAVPFVEKKQSGIEVRGVTTDIVRDLPFPSGTPMDASFSPNGRWLAVGSSDELRIYDTERWKTYDFGLIEEDRQFYRVRAHDDAVHAQALGKDHMSDSSDEYDYIIALRPNGPVLDRRVPSAGDEAYEIEVEGVAERVDGWAIGDLHRYRSAGIIAADASGWAYQVRCRDQALGAEDCDVQFIPIDVEKLMRLYDSRMWRPEDDELEEWVQSR